MDNLGGSGVYIVLAERYTSLATGVVDAALTTPSWMYDNKFYEVCPYFVKPHFVWGTGGNYLLNLDEWNNLPDELKQVLTSASREACYDWTRFRYFQEFDSAKNWVAQGGEIVTWSEEDMFTVVDTAQLYWDEVAAKSVRAAKAVELLKEFLRDLGYMK